MVSGLDSGERETACEDALHIAETPAQVVDIMDREIEDDATAALEVAVPGLRARIVATADRAHDAWLAQGAAVEHGFGLDELRKEAHDLRDKQAHTRGSEGCHHRFGVGNMARQRL